MQQLFSHLTKFEVEAITVAKQSVQPVTNLTD